jgi:nucleotide-binding universal stress UspA family protein
MSRTLSPVAARPSPRRFADPVLIVVAGAPGQDVPDWAPRCCATSGWELRRHPAAGTAAAAAAARGDARVLLLRPATAPAPRTPRVVAAVHRLPDDAPVVADAAACAARMGARLTVVHAVPRSFGERSVGLAGAVSQGRILLDAVTGHLAGAAEVELLRAQPYELVGEALDADLLVVGGRRLGDAPPRGLGNGPGLVAHSALHHAPCPVLLVPR